MVMTGPLATFAACLLDPDADVGNLVGAADIGAARFDVYRNNVMRSLIEALQVAFPALVRLLGDEYFDALAAEFARTHPPRSRLLIDYGDELPAFVEGYTPLAVYPYLGDVARLERLRIQAYHAQDESPGAFDDPYWLLAKVDQPRSARLSHSAAVLSSTHPVHSIWSSQFAEYDGSAVLPAAQSVLVWRRGHDVHTAAIDAATEAFLTAIDAGESVSAALDALGDAGSGFEITLERLLRDQVLVPTQPHRHDSKGRFR
jgi:hypothetical protein